jgi:hypothetical protein
MHPVLTGILYKCSLDSMYRPMGGQASMDKKLKRKHAVMEAKLEGKQKQALTWTLVESAAMQDHVVKVLDTQTTYACPRDVVRLGSLRS